MQPIDFEGSNVVYAKDQPQYMPLPVCKVPGDDGLVISIWKPTDEERQRISEGANIAVSMLTYNQPLQPLMVSVSNIEEKKPDEQSSNT